MDAMSPLMLLPPGALDNVTSFLIPEYELGWVYGAVYNRDVTPLAQTCRTTSALYTPVMVEFNIRQVLASDSEE